MEVGMKSEKVERYRNYMTYFIKKVFAGNILETIDNIPMELWPDGSIPKNYQTIEEGFMSCRYVIIVI
jgi:hypothetical protein